MQRFRKSLGASVLVVVGMSAACRIDMHVQPRVNPLAKSDFFTDQRSARPPVEGTVARGQLHEDSYFYTGKIGNNPGDAMPFPVTRDLLERGRGRYNIYCAPCHSRVGDGHGFIPSRGFTRKPPSFHEQRLQKAPLGYFFDVMTNGFGIMPDYASQIPPRDRWDIVAYIRALQLSQNATRADVPAGQQVKPLSAIAEGVGLPAQFASEWGLPATATTGTPSGMSFSIPPRAQPETLPGATKPSSGNTLATGNR